jgi:hypothetical protein
LGSPTWIVALALPLHSLLVVITVPRAFTVYLPAFL